MLAALDLATRQMTYRIRDRKRWREFLALLKLLRSRWPGQKLHVIADNFSPHKHPEGFRLGRPKQRRAGVPAHQRRMAELDRARIRRPALLRPQRNRPRTHAWQGEMIAAYVRWRNTRAQPKRNFAPNSVIRTWTDYKINVA
jgi:hypothetical protein